MSNSNTLRRQAKRVTSIEHSEITSDKHAIFIRDVTDKAKHLRDLAENARLASIGATVSKLIHELGSPLNGMYITAQLLERLVNKQITLPDAKITSTVNSLYREIQRLNSLLNEFCSGSGSEHFDFKPVSLAALIGEVISLERMHYIKRGVLVNQNVPTNLPSVIADADKLKQVFLNLCNNAVDAMPNGGDIMVESESGIGSVFTVSIPSQTQTPRAELNLPILEESR
jgi:signal transduction histidine kinase